MHRGSAAHERRDGPCSSDAGSRFSFHAYAGEGWSLEHIHAQNSQALKKENERRDWLSAHLKKIRATNWSAELASRSGCCGRRRSSAHLALPASKTDDVGFQSILDRTFALFSAPDAIPTGGRARARATSRCFRRDFNSKLSNAVFALKRERILELDEAGAYILPCTRNVFLKYYTASADQQLSIWGPQDQDDYYEKLIETVERLPASRPVGLRATRREVDGMKGYPTTFLGLFDAPQR